jgi:hypothetical protein
MGVLHVKLIKATHLADKVRHVVKLFGIRICIRILKAGSRLDYGHSLSNLYPLSLSLSLYNKDLFGKTDPYVRLELEQDNVFRDKDYGYQKSSQKQGDLNPVWNEDFTFNIPTLDNMVLTLKVMDHDVGSRDDKCGKCKVKLEHEGISRSPKRIEKCIDRNLLRSNGMIYLEIYFIP